MGNKKKIAAASLALGLIIPQVGPQLTYAEVANKDIVKLRIMETTDIHSHVVNYDYFTDKADETVGLVKTATLIKNAKAEAKNSLLFDNGDLIQGNPLADYVHDKNVLDEEGHLHPVYSAMNLLGYDAGNYGNHEFNYGLDYQKKATDGADFPYVNANVYKYDGDNDPSNDENYYEPYVLLDREVVDEDGEKHQIKVGVIGFAPPQITQWDKKHLDGKVVTHDIKETAEKFVPEMKEKGADVIVAIAHSGVIVSEYERMAENQSYELSKVDGVDAILFGHTHTTFPGKDYEGLAGIDNTKGTINGVAAVQPGFWGSHLGIIDLNIEKVDGKWMVISSQSEVRAAKEAQADQAILDAVKEDHEGTIDYVNAPVGKTETDLYSYFSQVQDDPTVQIVNAAQKQYIEKQIQGTELEGLPVLSAAAPLKAGRDGVSDYTDIAAGDIAIKDTQSLYKYATNTIKAVKLTGEQIIEWLEWSAGQFNQIDPNSKEEQFLVKENKSAAPGFPVYNFDVIDGIEYQIDVTKPQRYDNDGNKVSDAHRIVNVRFDGKPIDLKQEFLIVTNDYRAGGKLANPDGNNIVIDSPDSNKQVLVNYIRESGSVNPKADQNWSFAPIKGDVNLVFKSSPEAKKYAEGTDRIMYVETLADGFAKYKVDLSQGKVEQPTKPDFKDVTKDHWAHEFVTQLKELGIVKGKTETHFDPEGGLTRGQFVSMLVRALKLENGQAHPFKDVPAYLSGEVAVAYEAGITTGKSGTKFDPNALINREQMASMLIRAYEMKTGKEFKAEKEASYADAKSITPYAKEYVNGAYELNLMTGAKGNFNPKSKATRAQAAKVVALLLSK
ncbi:MAG TPA: bifunctional 2',3'-cyclic-nucleotide 2'-phosphodiesterase/3'-nucleotidase [Bacillus sp. (in: firmicutes)]|nr:bifunctional 2',3'-cyclic-nucleotide 2'-phosphodiesterase/3'-nucleotidase [Bacillus sp. (in: firmicutes)]